MQGIKDLELFKSVSYYLAEDFLLDQSDVIDLVILLEEKIYLLILPRVRVNEDATYLGMQIRWDNMFGLNHELRVVSEDRGDVQRVDERRQFIRYKYPNINGSKYELNLYINNQVDVDEPDELTSIKQANKSYSLGLFKWLNESGRNRGWFAGVDVDLWRRDNETLRGDQADIQTDASVLGFKYGFKNVHQYAFNRGGKSFAYELDISHKSLGSDSEFFKHQLYYQSYYRFKSRPNDNLNVQTLLGHSTQSILGEEAFSLGSNQDLRGYKTASFTGNARLLVNVEYMLPSDHYPSLRYVYFVDVGNTYDKISDVIGGAYKTGVGMGFRWKIPMFVRLDLRLDVGFGITDDQFRVSFGSKHTF